MKSRQKVVPKAEIKKTPKPAVATEAVDSEEVKKYQRFSVESVKTFAEAQGISSKDVSHSGWGALCEDLNYRLREVANLSAKFMKHSKRNRLLVTDVNDALKELKQQPCRGHRPSEPPKVHYLKDVKLYVPNEGVVDVSALALSKHFLPSTSHSQFSFEGNKINFQPQNDQISFRPQDLPPDVKVYLGEIYGMLRRPFRCSVKKNLLDLIRSRLLPTPLAVGSLSRLLLAQINHSPNSLISVGFVVELLAKCDCNVLKIYEDYVGSLGRALLESCTSLPDESWSYDICWQVGSTLKTLQRVFGSISGCDSSFQLNQLLRVLKNAKESPLAYSSALIILKCLGYPVLGSFDLLDLFEQHYSWNRLVFETTLPFEKGEITTSIARVMYVGLWRDLLEHVLSRLIIIFAHQNKNNLAELSWRWIKINQLSSLITLTTDVFGPLHLPLLEIIKTQKSPILTLPNLNISLGNRTLEFASKSKKDEAFVEEIETDEPEVDPPKSDEFVLPVCGKFVRKRPPNSSPKKRKRRPQEAFEHSKRFRLGNKDFIFVFHQTDAKVLIPEPPRPAPIKPESTPEWFKWLSKRGLDVGKVPKKKNNFANGFLDLATVIL